MYGGQASNKRCTCAHHRRSSSGGGGRRGSECSAAERCALKPHPAEVPVSAGEVAASVTQLLPAGSTSAGRDQKNSMSWPMPGSFMQWSYSTPSREQEPCRSGEGG